MEHSQSGVSHGHGRHMLIMVLCCLIPMLGIAAIAAFGIQLTGVLRYGLALICPLGFGLMMVMMMRGDQADAQRSMHEKPASESGAGSPGKGASCH